MASSFNNSNQQPTISILGLMFAMTDNLFDCQIQMAPIGITAPQPTADIVWEGSWEDIMSVSLWRNLNGKGCRGGRLKIER